MVRVGWDITANLTQTRMWVDVQRDGRPADYIGGTLCSTPQSMADTHYWSAM